VEVPPSPYLSLLSAIAPTNVPFLLLVIFLNAEPEVWQRIHKIVKGMSDPVEEKIADEVWVTHRDVPVGVVLLALVEFASRRLVALGGSVDVGELNGLPLEPRKENFKGLTALNEMQKIPGPRLFVCTFSRRSQGSVQEEN
jgi:hypothetical protein